MIKETIKFKIVVLKPMNLINLLNQRDKLYVVKIKIINIPNKGINNKDVRNVIKKNIYF
jgi:hypothetical protein